jgi:hypothetical protein
VELIREMVVKIQKNPIIFYIDDEAIPITEINFPAVSVCPGLILMVKEKSSFRPKEDYKHPQMLIDYNGLRRSFQKGLIDQSNFTDSEYEKLISVINYSPHLVIL